MILRCKIVVSIPPLLVKIVVMEYFRQIICETPLITFLLKTVESTNIASKAVPLGDILNDK